MGEQHSLAHMPSWCAKGQHSKAAEWGNKMKYLINRSIRTFAVCVTFPYLFDTAHRKVHKVRIELVTPVKCVETDDAVSLRTTYQPGDLHPASCCGFVTVVHSDSTGIQLQHVKLLATSVTIFVVSLTFTVINPEYHFEILHKNLLPDNVLNLLDAKKKQHSCSIVFK
jgi:hypothetical protein